mmetsp:Transcript_65429/g.75238  ORF Transcript_65429/g.75238 Transcript_65429/m.75238 type:complete len:406 (-) Transcript_65429:473-1690(-)
MKGLIWNVRLFSTTARNAPNFKNHYVTLGISPSSSIEDVKTAYRKLAKEYHPDGKRGDELKFKKIAESYEILSDPSAREEYDNEYGFGRKPGEGYYHQRPSYQEESRSSTTWSEADDDEFQYENTRRERQRMYREAYTRQRHDYYHSYQEDASRNYQKGTYHSRRQYEPKGPPETTARTWLLITVTTLWSFVYFFLTERERRNAVAKGSVDQYHPINQTIKDRVNNNRVVVSRGNPSSGVENPIIWEAEKRPQKKKKAHKRKEQSTSVIRDYENQRERVTKNVFLTNSNDRDNQKATLLAGELTQKKYIPFENHDTSNVETSSGFVRTSADPYEGQNFQPAINPNISPSTFTDRRAYLQVQEYHETTKPNISLEDLEGYLQRHGQLPDYARKHYERLKKKPTPYM